MLEKMNTMKKYKSFFQLLVLIVIITYSFWLHLFNEFYKWFPCILLLVPLLGIMIILYLTIRKYGDAKIEPLVKDDYSIYSKSDLDSFSESGKDSDVDKYLKMGLEFERYSLALFPESEWAVIDVSKDQIGKTKRRIESQKNPDMTLRNIRSGKSFIIECKYRSKFRKGINSEVVKWAEDYQMKNYAVFQKEKNLPFYVLLGIGGTPASPKQLFLIPFEKIKYKWLSKEYLKKYERQTKKTFIVNEEEYLK